MAGRFFAALLIAIGLLSVSISTVSAQQVCGVTEGSTEEVLPGVTLTYGSAFLCDGAAPSGSYQFTVTVTNSGDSVEAVRIDSIDLVKTTPRVRGQAPDATGGGGGATIGPGESANILVSGTYELVEADEGLKANLHFLAYGQGVDSGQSFELGINARFRG